MAAVRAAGWRPPPLPRPRLRPARFLFLADAMVGVGWGREGRRAPAFCLVVVQRLVRNAAGEAVMGACAIG